MNYLNFILHGSKLSQQITIVSFVALLLMLSLFLTEQVHAQPRTSYSIDGNNKALTGLDVETLLSQNILQAPALVTEGIQQTPKIKLSSNRVYIGDPKLLKQDSINLLNHSFSIFDARVNLIHDDDFDGFYHHFRVTFDADVDFGSALVFARMYISREGGPWNYYYTTKTFEIFENSDFDAHTVETIFTTGYPTGRYDIRVDLFEAGWADPVAVFGPNEDSDLYYLPLEDEEFDFYDGYNSDPYANNAGCSLSRNAKFDPVFPVMFIFSLLFLLRKYYRAVILSKNTLMK